LRYRALLSYNGMPDPLGRTGGLTVCPEMARPSRLILSVSTIYKRGTAQLGGQPKVIQFLKASVCQLGGSSIRKRPKQGPTNQTLPAQHASCSAKMRSIRTQHVHS
ncbi:mCG140125, partial [Mus musculus]